MVLVIKMNQTRAMVLIGCLMLVGVYLPFAAAHLAQDPGKTGAPSAGFGGPAIDWDPCRRHAGDNQATGAKQAAVSDAQADVLDPTTWQPMTDWVLNPDTCQDRVDTDGDTTLDTPNAGVSGNYYTAPAFALVECLGDIDTEVFDDDGNPIVPPNVGAAPPEQGTHNMCESVLFHHTTTAPLVPPISFPPSGPSPGNGYGGWYFYSASVCDAEFILGSDGVDETWIDNSNAHGGALPDGIFDDGGLGGACHVSSYAAGAPQNANTNGSDEDTDDDKDFNTNNADTQCRYNDDGTAFVREDANGNIVTDDKPYASEADLIGKTKVFNPHDGVDEIQASAKQTAYAEDWVLGADVPIVVTCDSSEAAPGDSIIPEQIVPGLVNCALPPTDVPCAQSQINQFLANQPDDLIDAIGDQVDTPGQIVGCLPYEQGGTVRASNLGKGGGHVGDGVTVPDEVDPCDQGDVSVMVQALVSANPFGNVYRSQADSSHDSGVDEHFGWPGVDSDAQVLSDWNSDGVLDGTGDTIVYPATNGWIDVYPFVDTSPDGLGCQTGFGHERGPTGLAGLGGSGTGDCSSPH